MKYKQICTNCGSDQVARLEWVNVNKGETLIGDPGVHTEWCFGCEGQTKIVEEKDERWTF